MKKRVLLACSKGATLFFALKWLIRQGYEVVCLIADVGQEEDPFYLRGKALKMGAKRVYIEDLQETFWEDPEEELFLPSLRTGYYYNDQQGSTMRGFLASRMLEIGKKEKVGFFAPVSPKLGRLLLQYQPNAKIVPIGEEAKEERLPRLDCLNKVILQMGHCQILL
ncbi:MAG: hypothetical protein FJZ63_01630 [Chlamydiae bacterium]|nr:hypothetical protein [Chlamydiota bacterium]